MSDLSAKIDEKGQLLMKDTLYNAGNGVPPYDGSPIGGVVFDLDDVLYPRRQYALGGYRAVDEYLFAAHGVRLYEAMAPHAEDGDGLSGLERALRQRFAGEIGAALIRCRHVYWTHAPRLTLYPDAAVALAYLRARRVRLGLVSRNNPCAHEAKARALGLDNLLDCLLCAGAPEYAESIHGSLMLAELALETPLRRMAYVGAAETADFASAREAGMIPVRVVRTGAWPTAAAESDPGPALVLPSLAALPGALLDYAASRMA